MEYTAEDINAAYILGLINAGIWSDAGAMETVKNELLRLKELGVEPYQMIDQIRYKDNTNNHKNHIT